MTLSIISALIVILAYLIHDAAKAGADARLFCRVTDDQGRVNVYTPIVRWAWDGYIKRWEWFVGGGEFAQHNGNPLKCDFWHLLDGHVRQLAQALGTIGAGAFVLANPTTMQLALLLPIGWLGYWLGGELFKYLFHVKFLADWTMDRFWSAFVPWGK